MRRRLAVALTAAALALTHASCSAPQKGRHLDSLPLVLDDPRAGGFSGLELDGNGTRLLAVSDRAVLLEARLVRQEGRLAGLGSARLSNLPGRDTERPGRSDSEALALSPDGKLWIAYEGRSRVMPRGGDGPLPRHPDFARLPKNRGLEALAVDAAGRLYALPERAGRGGFSIYRFARGAWEIAGMLPAQGRFVPVGADVGPDGALYVLERVFVGLGFRSRVRRVTFDEGKAGVQTLLTTPPGRHGNLEGIAVWTDAAGTLRLTMISDDNFMPFQRSEIVEYALP
jgi:hypothetical protein